jgi:hypothetical protein
MVNMQKSEQSDRGKMQRTLIIGNSGSGKSRLAKQIADLLGGNLRQSDVGYWCVLGRYFATYCKGRRSMGDQHGYCLQGGDIPVGFPERDRRFSPEEWINSSPIAFSD